MPLEMMSDMKEKISQKVKKVLFVCSANCCRSVMAERYFNKVITEKGYDLEAFSGGIASFQGLHASPETLRLLQTEDIDARDHRSQQVSKEILGRTDMVLVMTKMHLEFFEKNFPESIDKVFLLTDFYDGEYKNMMQDGVPDPIKMHKNFYFNVFEVIKKSVHSLLDKIR